MKTSPKLLLAFWVTLAVGAGAHSQDAARGRLQDALSTHASPVSSIPVASEPSEWSNYRRITRYATRFNGDHSLDAVTVTEQAFARYTLYAVRLQFVSGAGQSIVVTAPPGGLQPEMRDMNGDDVPNDVVLTSRLLRLPLIVLLNEGHDHLAVAISPGSLAANEDRASGAGQVHHASALPASRLKAGGRANSGGSFLPQLQEILLSPTTRITARPAVYTSRSGRAPPALVTLN